MKKIITAIVTLTLLLVLIPLATPVSAATQIDSVAVRVVTPSAGRYPYYDADLDTKGTVLDVEDDAYGESQENGVIWFCGDQPLLPTDMFEVGKVYTVRTLILRESTDYEFATSPRPAVTVNGMTATIQYGNNMYLSVEYTFPALQGYTVSFEAGNGSGTMAPAEGLAVQYALPACTFTPPSGKVFKAWSVNGEEFLPGEKISVYGNVTATALWKTKSTKTQIYDVVATSEDFKTIPTLYGYKYLPHFTVTQGAPAYVNSTTSNGCWQRKIDGVWVNDDAGRFVPGEWSYSVSIRIDGTAGTTHELGDPVTLTVNGQQWIPENGTGRPYVYTGYSMLFFRSPVITILDDPSIPAPVAVEKVAFGLEGYKLGADPAAVTVKTADPVVVKQYAFAEIKDTNNDGEFDSLEETTGTFSMEKNYAMMIRFAPKPGYDLANLLREDVTLDTGVLMLGQYSWEEDEYNSIYILHSATGYTVSFAAGGGKGTMDALENLYGKQALPECVFTAPTCKKFKAWSVNGTEKKVGDTITVSADTTVTALWTDAHTYTNSCDATCNVCSAKRNAGHKYANSCDTTCNTCSAKRTITHTYTNSCDKTCNVCKATRTITHSYTKSSLKATLKENGKLLSVCKVCGYVSSKTTTIYKPTTFKLSTTEYTYNGKVKTPAVTVKDSKGNTLKKDTDYTVKYESGRKMPGKYTVTITLKGNYSGTKKLTFTIKPRATSQVSATQTTTTITLKWKKVTGADGYRVYQYNAKTKKYEKLKDVTGTTLKISKLKAGTTYKYKVRAFTKDNGTIMGAYSDVFATATKPATPKITKLTSTKGKASLTWSNVSGESGYQVYYSAKKDSGFKKAASYKVNVLKGAKTKLTSGKNYYFKVRAYKKTDSGTVYSAWSAVKRVKIK